ncbi:hypothetical protein ACE6H2_007477 [Prunus campanulata]
MSLRWSSKQLAVFGNSTILDHSPYPTGVKDHDYKTWGYKRNSIHAFFFWLKIAYRLGNSLRVEK